MLMGLKAMTVQHKRTVDKGTEYAGLCGNTVMQKFTQQDARN